MQLLDSLTAVPAPLQIDEDFDNDILRGVLRKLPATAPSMILS